MSSKQLPTAIAAFLRAAKAHDSSALLATLADGAVVTELGKELRGDALRRWSDEMFVNSRLIVRPLDPAERDGDERSACRSAERGRAPRARCGATGG